MTPQYAIAQFYDEAITLESDAVGNALVFETIQAADEVADYLDKENGEPYTRVISLEGVHA